MKLMASRKDPNANVLTKASSFQVQPGRLLQAAVISPGLSGVIMDQPLPVARERQIRAAADGGLSRCLPRPNFAFCCMSAPAANVPRHVAIIMDGNGRWATKRGLPRIEGHRRGVETVRTTTFAARDLGVRMLTLYAFSIENWKRP